MSLTGEEGSARLAVVTGAGRRIGQALALALARRGYTIGLHYHRSQESAEQTALEIQQMGGKALLLQADLTEPGQIEAMFARLANETIKLSVLVNSAAVMQQADLRTMSVEDWDQNLALNLRAPWLCARAAASQMLPDGGAIINISDTGTNKAWTRYPAYTVSKAGLDTLTRLLARSLAPQIRVNAVAPGLILRAPEVSEEDWQRLVQRLPMRRAGGFEPVVQAVEYLLENTYVTGQTIVVDGGYQLI